MTVLLQISDPHFGTEQGPVVEALVALALQQRPELTVLSGDITQRALEAQFRAARAFLARLHAPVLAVPGNHDIPLYNLWARVFHPYAGYRAAFGHALEPIYNGRELLVVGVNTTRPHRHKNGEVSATQIQRVAGLLAEATAEQLRVVVLHQPIAVVQASDVKNRLRGYAQAQQAWAGAGADIVLGGHIHLPYVTPLLGLPRPMWAVQAGTAVSRRVRGNQPNSVNLLRWGGGAAAGACQVEQWDFDAARQRFACTHTTLLQPARERHAN